jgi:hypothetical protein
VRNRKISRFQSRFSNRPVNVTKKTRAPCHERTTTTTNEPAATTTSTTTRNRRVPRVGEKGEREEEMREGEHARGGRHDTKRRGRPCRYDFWCVYPRLPHHPLTNNLRAPAQPPTTASQPRQRQTSATSPHTPAAHPLDSHVTHSNKLHPTNAQENAVLPPRHPAPPLFEGCGRYVRRSYHHRQRPDERKRRDTRRLHPNARTATPPPAAPTNAGARCPATPSMPAGMPPPQAACSLRYCLVSNSPFLFPFPL